MENSLPQGWSDAQLSELTDIIMGQSPPSELYNTDGIGLPFFQGKTEFTSLHPVVRKWCSNPNKIAQPNDILISVRAPVGPTNIADKVCGIGRGLAAIRYESCYKYVFYFLRSIENTLEQYATGSTFTAISGNVLRELSIPVAPLAEQHRIVAKLDALMQKVESNKQRLEQIPKILKRFRQSVLNAAIDGRLTANWREVKGLGKWSFKRAEDICRFITKGTTPKGAELTATGDIPFLKVYNIVDQKIDFSAKPQFVSKPIHDGVLKRSKVVPGDVLMNIVGPPLGKVAIVTNQYPEWNLNQAIAIFRPNAEMLSEFAYLILREGTPISEIEKEFRGTAGQSNISLEQCRDFSFPVPEIEEQQEIVKRVHHLFAFADKIEARYKKAKAQLDKLPQSILAKAFRGELVPQDPADEPAGVLLERIQAERNSEKVSKVRGAVKKSTLQP